MAKTTIEIPDSKMAALEALAEREHLPPDELILRAIDIFVASKDQHMPKAIGIFEDTEVNSTNVRDWLRENWRPE